MRPAERPSLCSPHAVPGPGKLACRDHLHWMLVDPCQHQPVGEQWKDIRGRKEGPSKYPSLCRQHMPAIAFHQQSHVLSGGPVVTALSLTPLPLKSRDDNNTIICVYELHFYIQWGSYKEYRTYRSTSKSYFKLQPTLYLIFK